MVANSSSIRRLIAREALHAGRGLARCLAKDCEKLEAFKGANYCTEHAALQSQGGKQQ